MTGPPSPLRFSRLLKAVGGLALLLAVVAFFFDWNWLRPAIVRYLSHTSQRSIRVDDLYVHFSSTLAPTIRLRGVRVQNAPWANAQPMAVAGEVTFTFKSLWTLFQAQSQVALVQMKDADIDLERQADGLRNWRLNNPENRGPGKYLIQRVEAHNSRLRVVHRGIDLDVTMASSAAAGDLPNRIKFSGIYAGSPFSGDLLTSPEFSLQQTQEFFPIRGSAQSGDTHFTMDGRMADFLKIGAVDAQIRIDGRSLARLHPFLRGSPPASPPYRAQGHLHVDQAAYGLDHFHATVGATDIAGDLSRSRYGRRVWHADLRSEQAHMADLTAISFATDPAHPDAGPVAAKPGAATGDHLLPTRPLNSQRLQSDDAHVRLELKKITSPQWPMLQGLRATADLQNGVLKIAPLDIAIAGGRAGGEITLDGSRQPMTASTHLDLRNLQLRQLVDKLHSAGDTSAPLAARIDLQGHGDTVAALLGSATGSASLSMAPGRISNLLDAMLGLNGGKVVWLKLTGDHDIALNCASVAIDFHNGIGKSRDLLLDTAQTRASGSATIDLRDERFDLLLTPHAKQTRLFSLGSAIHAHGSFRHAEYSIEKGSSLPVPATAAACPVKMAQGTPASAAN